VALGEHASAAVPHGPVRAPGASSARWAVVVCFFSLCMRGWGCIRTQGLGRSRAPWVASGFFCLENGWPADGLSPWNRQSVAPWGRRHAARDGLMSLQPHLLKESRPFRRWRLPSAESTLPLPPLSFVPVLSSPLRPCPRTGSARPCRLGDGAHPRGLLLALLALLAVVTAPLGAQGGSPPQSPMTHGFVPVKEQLYILGVSQPLLGHVLPLFNLLEHLQAAGHRVALLTADVSPG
jgi:hypothetical protein